jgi:2-polyprenyl-3-methyl-5-hydroxy-6-metoxy-1,4-benzoquinol methylase
MGKDYRQRIYAEYATNFQDAADIFDLEASRRWGKAYRSYLLGWLPADKDADIVDLACGGGKLLHLIQMEGYRRICGVDIRPDQISRARQVTEQVILGDAIDFLEKQRNRFDLIIGLDIIEHFHKPEVLRFLDCCHDALKPRGRLVLQTPNAESPWGGSIRYGDLTHEVCFNPNALSRLLRLAGFSDIEAREAGPVLRGGSLVSTARYALWQAFRAGLTLWNLAETGCRGSGVFTRVFLVSGLKR